MPTTGEDVPDDVTLTQTGQHDLRSTTLRSRHTFSFRSGLRADRDESYMSVIGDHLSIEEAVPIVCRGDLAGEADAVRYAATKDLRTEGFAVTWEESRTVPNHVAVRWDGEWEVNVSSGFDSAFRQYEPGPGAQDE